MNEQFDNANQISTEVETAVPDGATTTEVVKICPNCKTTLSEEQKFCPNCGSTVAEELPQTLTCTKCGTEVPSETKFCPKCGTAIVMPLNMTTKEKSNKKKLFLIGGIVAIATIIILCFALREIPVEDIVLSETKIELKEEETKNISCTVYPEKATDKTVIWASSDNSVATVNSYGRITAVGKGTCTITAKSGDQTETISVTVKTKIDFNELYKGIPSSVRYGFSVAGDGSYLSADTNVYNLDDYFNYDIRDAITELHEKMGLPESLDEDMWQTTWSMGKQHETFEKIGITVSWTYHPDKGLEVTYKLIDN